MQIRHLTIALSIVLSFSACVKFTIPITPPIPTGTYLKGSWQCQIDGINYSGTIDTSFSHGANDYSKTIPDTVLFCTGTTLDKTATIHFQIRYAGNSNGNSNAYYPTGWQSQIEFDTCSNNILTSNISAPATVNFYIDSDYSNSVQGHFSGTLASTDSSGAYHIHAVNNGSFTAGLQGGDHDANSFVYTDGLVPLGSLDKFSDPINGYFLSASMATNTLVLDGKPIDWGDYTGFQLLIRTGGTIKPGTYTSANGDVGLYLSYPGYYYDYVVDSSGSLNVTITQVSGNTIYGNFSGSNWDGTPLSGGSFAVRIKGYVPEADSANKWGFGTFRFQNGYGNIYNIYGGNVVSASETTTNGRYALTVNGESDHGLSALKIIISSTNPIQKGTYIVDVSNQGLTNTVDSIYFVSPNFTWYGNSNYYYGIPMVVIDSIDAHHVQGEIKGYSAFSEFYTYLQQGRFSASF